MTTTGTTAPTSSPALASESLVELAVVIRSGVIESRHIGSIAALAADGSVAWQTGSGEQILPRSTVKPVQALACVLAGADIDGADLAIAAGSHTGEDAHVDAVRDMLTRAGLDDDALGCPVDWPEDEPTRERLIRDGEKRSRVRMNCSGKHAAMLLACSVNGWDTGSYLDVDHPLQQLVRSTLERLSGESVAHDAVDGCGAPLFSVSPLGIARIFRALVTADPGSPERRVADAMREFPRYVGGDHHANTDAMIRVPGLLSKGGAEGVIGMATADGASVSMKIADGNPRATTLVALTVLQALGADISGAGDLVDLPILGGGVPVGSIRVGSDVRAWIDSRTSAATPSS